MNSERSTGALVGLAVANVIVFCLGTTYAPDATFAMAFSWVLVGTVAGILVGSAIAALLFPSDRS